jgi:drug/metabolite transporter (DMT)-like permease
VATALGEWGDVTRHALQAGPVAAWVYLAVFGSVIAFTAYAWLLGNAPISQVVTHQYVNPIVALTLGALFLGERLHATTLLGAATVLAAVFVTVRIETRAARTSESVDLGATEGEVLEQV